MKRKFHTPEQIVKKLREADAAIASRSLLRTVTNDMKISNSHCKRDSLISDLGLFSRAYSLGLRLTARGSIRLGREGQAKESYLVLI